MTYTELFEEIKTICAKIQNINHCSDVDIYSEWIRPNIQYSAVNVYLQSAQRTNNTIIYNMLLYYGDRLLQDGSNRDSIFDDGIRVLQTILDLLPDDVTYSSPVTYNTFEQQFADNLAGVFASISFETTFALGSCGLSPLRD